MSKKEDKPYKKQPIKSCIRNAVWNTYIGSDKKIAYCYFGCGEIISTANFECGHIQAESKGGETSIRSIRPICGQCNKSSSTANMLDFIKEYHFDSPLLYEVDGKLPEKYKESMLYPIIISSNGSPVKLSSHNISGSSSSISSTSSSSQPKISSTTLLPKKSVKNTSWKSFEFTELHFATENLIKLNKLSDDISKYNTEKLCRKFLSSYDRVDDYLYPYFNSYTKDELTTSSSLKSFLSDVNDKSKKIIVEKLVEEYKNKNTHNLYLGVSSKSLLSSFVSLFSRKS